MDNWKCSIMSVEQHTASHAAAAEVRCAAWALCEYAPGRSLCCPCAAFSHTCQSLQCTEHCNPAHRSARPRRHGRGWDADCRSGAASFGAGGAECGDRCPPPPAAQRSVPHLPHRQGVPGRTRSAALRRIPHRRSAARRADDACRVSAGSRVRGEGCGVHAVWRVGVDRVGTQWARRCQPLAVHGCGYSAPRRLARRR